MSIKEETFNIARVTHEAAADAAKLSMSTKSSILTEVARKIRTEKEKSSEPKLEGYRVRKEERIVCCDDRPSNSF